MANRDDVIALMNENHRLRISLAKCSDKLRRMAIVFSGSNYSDRHNDGPEMLRLADEADNILKRGLYW